MRALLWCLLFIPILHGMENNSSDNMALLPHSDESNIEDIRPPSSTPPPYDWRLSAPQQLSKTKKIIAAGSVLLLGAGGVATDFIRIALNNEHAHEPYYINYASIFSRAGLMIASLLLLLKS